MTGQWSREEIVRLSVHRGRHLRTMRGRESSLALGNASDDAIAFAKNMNWELG